MTQQTSLLAFFGDAEAAKTAFSNLERAGFRQTVSISKTAPDPETKAPSANAKFAVARGKTIAPRAALLGATLGLCAGELVNRAFTTKPRATAGVLPTAGALIGGVLGWGAGSVASGRLPEKRMEAWQNGVMNGETLVVVRAQSQFLRQALEILRESSENGPVVFVERPHLSPQDVSRAPLRRDALNADNLRDLAMDLGRKHLGARKVARGDSNSFLRRLGQNKRIIASVVRGLSEAARLGQTVSLSTEWLLDNNYVIQSQIKDVERNLTPKFTSELPVLQSGKFAGVPRLYVLASELISALDSRLDKEHLLEFVHSYQRNCVLTTGELWAFPLILRLALVENLRRLTAQADVRQRERERADYWANRLLSAAFREPDQLLPLMAQLSKEHKVLAPQFADRLVSHLFDEESALGPVRAWLERKLDAPLAEITSREQRRQAADSVSVGHVITSLRFLASLDWRECFEQLSLVDAILAQDPAGVYRSMDFVSRDRYRSRIERIARGAKKTELEVARTVVSLAADASRVGLQRAAPSHGQREHETLIYSPTGHVGYYLIDEGSEKFESDIGYRASRRKKIRRWLRDHPAPVYFGSMAFGTGAALWILGRFARSVGGALPFPLRLLAFLPASEVAVQVVNYAVTRIVPPRPLPKMEFESGIPDRWKTAVVIPMLLGKVEDGIEAAHQLEIHYLANPDANLRFALLADFLDAAAPQMPEDDAVTESARGAIAALNVRYGERFSLFLRDRRWSDSEERWMGWERKRGKLEEFNAWVSNRWNGQNDHLHSIEGDIHAFIGTKFVVTLDADTQLPFGAAMRLIETLAHPLNRPVVGKNGLVTRGYGIIQPRVDTMLPSATATRFSRLFTDASGSDPYTHVVSDVYQDAFGEGSYHGKGIYDLEAFERVLGDRFPDATLLSHDLLEGAHVRVGLASDVVLLDKFPPQYLAASKRDHRWIRGDWQILDWVFGRVPTPRGREINPLSAINRWKVFDNLRRSLLAPASVGMLLGGWVLGGSAAIAGSVGVAGLLLWPTGINIFTRLTTSPGSLVRGHHEIRRGLLRAGIETSLLLHRAGLCLDAIARVLSRKYGSHKLMLEWQTAASTYGGARTQELSFLLRLAAGSGIAGATALFLTSRGAVALVAAAPYLLAWGLAPAIVWWLGRGRVKAIREPLNADNQKYLREVARETWRYFDDFIGPQTNWLPPDNYQEALNVEIAQRTSPTNIGLWLLACNAAHDFGWIPLDEVAARTLATLETFDDLEKHEGHLLNWYHSGSLEALHPRYVSTVDSGNLLGSLWTLARSMKEQYRAPIFDAKPLAGARDVLGVLELALGDDRARFESELGELHRLLDLPVSSPLAILRALRALERPANALGRNITLKMLAPKTTLRARSDLNTPTTDPRIAIAAPSYWAAQLETQLDLWLQTASRYGRWMEELAAPADEFLLSLGLDAPDLRRRALETSFSLVELARGQNEILVGLLERRNSENVPPDVRDWAQKVWDEWNRSCWLAGEMMADCDSVVERSRAAADAMKMRPLYDEDKRLFSIGYNVDERRLDANSYDLLASECRLASFCAVARGDVPAEHWIALGRRFGRTSQGAVLLSWSGTMFEYLMPLLFQKAFENSLLERAVQMAVRVQIAYGERRGVPWGISEAAFSALDAARTYQYKAFGTPSLGLKRGLEDDLVIAPYASLMATMVEPNAAVANLKALEKMGLRGDYGFYESIDFTRERLIEDSLVTSQSGEIAKSGGRGASAESKGAIVRCFMVHHQGMGLLALQNVLLDWPVQRRFHSDVFVEAAEPLLFEKIPEAPPILTSSHDQSARPPRVDGVGAPVERAFAPDTPSPRSHLLGSPRYSVMLTAAGGGFSRWGDFEITRWRSDTTRDNWGQFLYLKDAETKVRWSIALQPLKNVARRQGVSFKAEKVEFNRLDAEIESQLEICVSPEDDVEVRRVTLVNRSNHPRNLELTTFMELALAPHVADRAHPSFNKLFIQTAIVSERDALLAWRRPRKNGEEPVWAFHSMCSPENARDIQFETDRSRFLGRGRSAQNPFALENGLSGTAGAVLDPCFSLRRRVVLSPGQRLQIAFVTGAASSEERAGQLIEKYSDFAACERAFDLAWTHSQLELHHLQIKADEAQAFQQLAGYLLYPHAALRAPGKRLRENVKGQSGLWAYGISGDLPILLVAIDNARDLPAVRGAIMAHTFWRVRGLKCDLVILNEQAGGYAQDLTETLQKMVNSSTPYTGAEKPGGVFLRTIDTVAPEDLTLLLSVANVVLVAARGAVSQQLGAINDDNEPQPRFVATQKEANDATIALPFLELPYFNSLGGFTDDGREYAIYLGPGDRTPAPWINVFAHEHFGAIVSESGQGFAWFGNSQSNRLTPWNNDPVSDTPGEAIYLRDEDTGAFWTATALPIRENEAYRARHGQGYSVHEHNSRGIEAQLTTFVPNGLGGQFKHATPPVRVQRLKLVNRTNRRRRLSATFACEWVLGTTREETQMHVVTSWDTQSNALFARNVYHPDFASRVAFASATPMPTAHSGDRTAFLGRNGSWSDPVAMKRKNIVERVGAALDPAAILQVPIDLGPGEEITVSFLLGEAASADEAREIVAMLRAPGAVDRALDETRGWWDGLLSTVQVETPDKAINFLLNRWLPYQTLSCRIWARSAFYQSGGAWGFRDQLQDSLALTTLYPAITRAQILRSAKQQFEEGDVQHWWHPPGNAGVRTLITDDLLFLPYAVAQYVKTTGDTSILDESVSFLHAPVLEEGEHEKYFQPQISSESATIFEHCRRAIEKGCTFGPHGLPLIGGGDWNDGLNRVGIEGKGESVWLAWFATDVLNGFSEVCELRGETNLASDYKKRAQTYVQNIESGAWDGEYYRRGYFDDGTPLGSAQSEEAKIDSLPQSWALIAGGGDTERAKTAMASLEKHLILKDEEMVLLFTPAFDKTEKDPGYIKGYLPGVRENGGQYTHAACWVAYAYARGGFGQKAVETLRLLNPVEHARTPQDVAKYKVEPYVVAADVYNLEGQIGRGGWTWYTGSCGWMYRVWMEGVLGFDRRGDTLRINPSVPTDWREFKIHYRHLSTQYEIQIENFEGVEHGVREIELDGAILQTLEIPLVDDGLFHRAVVRMGAVKTLDNSQNGAAVVSESELSR